MAKIKGDKRYSIVTDHLGTPILGYSDSGDKVWERELDSFGKARMSIGDEGFCNYLYQGQTLDKETGLAYNRFRYYSPEEGNYISQDPIGLAGGNPTLYGYVGDSSLWIDPFGLNCVENKEIAKELSEPEVKKRLKEKYPKDQFEILTEPRIYINGKKPTILPNGKKSKKGTYSKPDFMVIDRATGNVVDLVDAKNGGAGFTDLQKELNSNGGTFNGSSRSKELGKGTTTQIGKDSLRIERTNFTELDLENHRNK